MTDEGRLTAWTAFLVLAGIALVITGAALAPDGRVYVWLLTGGWAATMIAFNTVYSKIREKVREQKIREDERRHLS